ncbi:MAG TPA: hypothetical protein DIS53_01760 [Candidatus Wildermuthbacteria bacterium]|uniref:Uncharacterized protein n=1 Tax=Candidatus Yanofskybacteria bacterium GW2011_GWC1_48_11 TaxID=1619027 RepID=A0A837IR50_9BACT|nr:MAG: hypothetical protein UY25_C0001G0100 [Candidatus Yanofskybacteria bacterium GW2011_GWC1_48_11]KKW03925.1 MAG: hypothetical protein UY38_C0002G0079 [Parcubacteria group bacterium GW2011_GWB1_49_12]OHA65392.1 MAG: hypothetical protein A2674_01105 [Candidatus Wildermuthbacteria bacterium RIFCSPHIGHO2_01_FULL_50_47]OHA72068.1 MAG: hypothetical protein A3E08_00645 [Candidatus Wildermuthbacteria bacterium RIFCSPHIGHO2_12_FULL_49_13]OHA74568.1 MAG: hypothetical protein A3B28_03950 [Candidatus 
MVTIGLPRKKEFRIPWWILGVAIAAIVVGAALGAVLPTMIFGGKTAATDVPAAPVVNTAQIERPAPPAPVTNNLGFQGRAAPSAAFPLSDEEYLAASQQALADPNTQGVQDAFATLGLFGDSSRIVVSPRRVDEVRGALYITYEAKTPEGDLFRRMGRTLDIMVGFEPATGWRASVQPRSQ